MAGQEKSYLHNDDGYHTNNNQEEKGHDTTVSCNLKRIINIITKGNE